MTGPLRASTIARSAKGLSRITLNIRNSLGNALNYGLLEPVRQEPRVLLLALSTMLITLGQGAIVPILPLLVQSYGMTATMVGVAVSAFALARAFANIPSGILSRRHGARSALVLGAIFSAVGNLMVGLTSSFAALTGFRFVAGLGSALYITAAVIFVAEVSTPENRARLMGIYQTAFLLGISLGPSVGGITAELFGLHAPFILVAAVSALAGIWAWARIPANVARIPGATKAASSTAQITSEPQEGPPSIFRSPAFVAISFIAMAVFFTRGGALFTLFPLLAKERFGLSVGEIGLLFTVPSVVNLVCQPFVGALADRLGRKILIVPTVFLFAVSLVVSAVSPIVGIFAVGLTFYGVGQAIEAPTANSYVADLAPPEQRAMALGVFRTFGDAGLVIGAPLLGFIADRTSIPWGLITNAGLILIPGLLFILVAKETAGRKHVAPTQQDGSQS